MTPNKSARSSRLLIWCDASSCVSAFIIGPLLAQAFIRYFAFIKIKVAPYSIRLSSQPFKSAFHIILSNRSFQVIQPVFREPRSVVYI
jgi:hypothetical protein